MKVMKTPRSVELAITGKCNLRCKYCSYFKSAADVGQDLALDEWLAFFKELNRCAVMNVTLQGAEPFTRQDLKQIISAIVQNRMRFSILTNGTLITNEMAHFLASTKRCDTVQVSIDSHAEASHDSVRGEGSLTKAVEGIKRLKRNKVKVSVRVTINKQNLNDLDGVAKLLLEEIRLPGFSTNSASYMGLCKQNASELQLSAKERTFAIGKLLELNRKYNGRIGAMAGPLAEGQYWLQMRKAYLEKKPSKAGHGCLTSCGGVFNKIGVRADGVIVPCLMLSHIDLGQINKDSLKDVWQNNFKLRRLRQRQKVTLDSFEFCRDCDYISYCRGGCPALAYTILGDDNHPSPDSCFRKFLAEGGELPDQDLSSCEVGV